MTSPTPSYWHRLRRLSRNAKLYLAGSIFRAVSRGIWLLLFNLYLASMGFDEAFIGLTNALFTAFSLVSSLPAGLIADRIGRKRAMLIGLAGMTLSRLGVAVFTQGWLIAASSALFSIAGPLFLTSVPPFLTENSTVRERALLFTLDWSLMSFFMFIGTTVGGYLPQWFATVLHTEIESTSAYRGAMLAATAMVALGLLPILGLKHKGQPPSPQPAAHLTRRFWSRFSNPRLLVKLTVPRMLLALGAGLIFPFFNLFYKQRFGLSDAALGWIFGITNILAALMMLGGGAVAERLGKVRAMLIARTISTPMLLIIGFVPALPIVVAAHWIRSGLMRLGEPLYMAFAMEQLGESERATGSSLMTMSWDVGWSAAPYLSGLVQVRYGFDPLFVSCVALYGLSLVCIYRFFGRRRGAEGTA